MKFFILFCLVMVFVQSSPLLSTMGTLVKHVGNLAKSKSIEPKKPAKKMILRIKSNNQHTVDENTGIFGQIGDKMHFWCENKYFIDQYVTIKIKEGKEKFKKFSLVLKPKTSEKYLGAVVVKSKDFMKCVEQKKCKLQFILHDGDPTAIHDTEIVYKVPYECPAKANVRYGYGPNVKTHRGMYAWDWFMPIGTKILAARSGVVVDYVETNDNKGCKGLSPRTCKRTKVSKANYVIIRHSDGTLGGYFHINKNSVKLTAGETVNAGDHIADSGNSGYSFAPHLHFHVQKSCCKSLITYNVQVTTKCSTSSFLQADEDPNKVKKAKISEKTAYDVSESNWTQYASEEEMDDGNQGEDHQG